MTGRYEAKANLYNILLAAFIALCITTMFCSYQNNQRRVEIEMVRKGMYKGVSTAGHEIWLPKEVAIKNKEQM